MKPGMIVVDLVDIDLYKMMILPIDLMQFDLL